MSPGKMHIVFRVMLPVAPGVSRGGGAQHEVPYVRKHSLSAYSNFRPQFPEGSTSVARLERVGVNMEVSRKVRIKQAPTIRISPTSSSCCLEDINK